MFNGTVLQRNSRFQTYVEGKKASFAFELNIKTTVQMVVILLLEFYVQSQNNFFIFNDKQCHIN